MPKGQIVFLLLQLILIKIGQAEIWLIKFLIKLLKILADDLWFLLKKIAHLPTFHLPAFRPHIKIPYLKHKKGRPRKNWLLPYYLNKFKLYFKRKVTKRTKIAYAVTAIIIMIYIYTSIIFAVSYQLPSPKRLTSTDKALTTEIFDRNGKLLYRLYEGRNRMLVNLKNLPPYFIQATLAAEDRNFYKHPGIDPLAIIRAFKTNLKNLTRGNNQNLEGASTLTQQLIKNTLLTPEKTYTRKIKEIILALVTERMYTKDEILGMYINEAPYGGDKWGVEAASQGYFGKSTEDLTLAESSFLAGLPASPTQFSPYSPTPKLSKVRQKEVLQRMVENKFISQNQADEAYLQNLNLKPPVNNIKAPHFVMFVKEYLSAKFGPRVVSQGGLKITTTLDLNIQEKVEDIVAKEAERLTGLNVQNAAAMVLDAPTGQILAMQGSKDYHNDEFGAFNVTTALRQPGSSIKVVTYISAFKNGYSPGNTILDVPVVFRDNWGNVYAPQNYDGAYHGAVSLRQALGSSYNIPAVKLESNVGLDEVIKTAREMGITTFTDPKRYGLALTLGAAEVKMIDMMSVYGSLSQLGQKNTPTPIIKITDSEGNILEEYEHHPVKVISEEAAYLISHILADNNARKSAFGEKSELLIAGKTVPVKTGTSDNKRDNWTFGYTPKYVVGVWVGNPDNSPMHPSLTSGVTGAAPIWNKIMVSLLEGKNDEIFKRPKGIVEVKIDGRKDLAIADIVPKSLVKVSQKDKQVLYTDPFSNYATPSAKEEQAGINLTNQ